MLIGFTIISIALAYLFGQELLKYLSGISYFEKISQIQNALDEGQYYENYPLILRPAITFISLLFMTATGVKSIVLLIIAIIAIIAALVKLTKVRSNNSSLATILSALLTISLITLTIPTHAYAKYYIFLLPFFVNVLLQVYTREALLYFFTFLTIIAYINIIIFYI